MDDVRRLPKQTQITKHHCIQDQPNDANGYLAGTLDMTVFGTTAPNTVVGAGGDVTVSVPSLDAHFHWSPGASCPDAAPAGAWANTRI